jgi:hypothetical protein
MLYVDFTQEAVEIESNLSTITERIATFVTGSRVRNGDSIRCDGGRPLTRTIATSTRSRDPKTGTESLFYTSEIDINTTGTFVVASTDRRGNERVFRCAIETEADANGTTTVRFKVLAGGAPATWLCDDRDPTRILADEDFVFEFQTTYEHNERTGAVVEQDGPRPSAWDRIDTLEDDGQ